MISQLIIVGGSTPLPEFIRAYQVTLFIFDEVVVPAQI